MSKVICPKDCPNRRASPNCHNVNTCETWAVHVAEVEAERKDKYATLFAEYDVRSVRTAFRAKTNRELDRKKKRRLP